MEDDGELIMDTGSFNSQPIHSQFCLVGRFLTDRPLNFNVLQNRMASVWRSIKGVCVKDIGGGLYLFHFFHAMDIKRVLEGGPWSFDNYMLVLYHFQFGEMSTVIPLVFLDIWVQLFWRGYMRIKVQINTSKPLKKNKRIRNKDGAFAEVQLKCERLGVFCFVCGMIGHLENFCEVFPSSGQGELFRGWGPKLRAATRRITASGSVRWLRQDMSVEEDGVVNMKSTVSYK
ncbi:hypothetical protein PTKIN_Ptkin01aG0116600 [Pterospermum kingtungense]